MAKVLAKASGWKSLPACPPRAKTGTKARMMIAIALQLGLDPVDLKLTTAVLLLAAMSLGHIKLPGVNASPQEVASEPAAQGGSEGEVDADPSGGDRP